MKTPAGSNFPLGSDHKSYLGRLRPGGGSNIMSLRPTPGLLKSVHANDLSALNPCPGNQCWYSEANKQNGPWALWTGGVFAPDYSTYGAMVYWGGGHQGYDGTEHYVFDLTTQQWSRLGNPIATDFHADIDATWCDYQTLAGPVVAALHTYAGPVYLSPTQGGGPKGSWCMPFNVYGPLNGIQGSYNPHAVDLATGMWSRLTAAPYTQTYPGGPNGCCFVDTKRGVIWGMMGNDDNRTIKIDLMQSTKTIVPVTSFYAPGTYALPVYVEAKDLTIAAYVNYGTKTIRLKGFDLATGTPVEFTITQGSSVDTVFGPGMGMDWCPDTGKFYLYEGVGTTLLYVLTPPTNWKTGTWTWSTETMGGEAPANTNEVQQTQGPMPFTKWKYNPALQCFMWSQGTVSRPSPDGTARTGAFQLYRPLGT